MSVSVKTKASCPISGTREAMIVCRKDRHGKPLRNVINVDSGLIFVDPVPFDNTEEFYKSEYRKSYKGVHCPKPKHVYRAGKIALERFERVNQLVSDNATTLDAGSSSGEFVYLLQKRGYKTKGIEANEPYAEYSRSELEVDISIQPFSQYFSNEEFDLITMFHVLEHLENPVRDLRKLSERLKPNGYFVIEVPNILYRNMSFSHKWHPGHLFSYTAETLSKIMGTAGLETIKCSPLEDGGNLWGVFRKTQNKAIGETESLEEFEVSKILRTLRFAAFKYYANPKNYIKFLYKLMRQFAEKNISRGKPGREILDALFH
jgi:2-polyprenyl-3-methyl-5-hydroxy-6-metoxy-1,4-benzoquinol methylase